MKKIIATLVSVAFCCALSAQQTIKSEDVGAFGSVSLSGNVRVELVKSDRNSIDVKLYDADIKYFKWAVSKEQLSVSLRPMQTGKGYAEIVVNYRDTLQSVSLNSAELSIPEPVVGKVLRLTVSGGGKLNAEVDVLDLELLVSGNSAVELKGTAKYVSLRATEKSRVDIRAVECVSMYAETTTGAEAYVTATERLAANAKTGSTIFYRGAPAITKDLSSRFSNTVGSSVLSID